MAYINSFCKWIWNSHASIVLAKSNAGFSCRLVWCFALRQRLRFCLFRFRCRNIFFDSMHFVIKAQTNASSGTLYAILIFAFHILFMFVPKLVFILTSIRIIFPGTDLPSMVAIAWVIWLMMSAVVPTLYCTVVASNKSGPHRETWEY